MKKTSWKSPMLLLLTAVIWGVAFVAQSVGMEYVGGFTFNCTRNMIGGLVLLPCIAFLDRIRTGKNSGNSESESRKSSGENQKLSESRKNCGEDQKLSGSRESCSEEQQLSGSREKCAGGWDKTLWLGGICCGLALFIASNLQQFGIKYTTVGKAGFITAMYIIIVPVMGIFLKKTVGTKVWISVVLGVIGLYLLCITEGFSLGFGDILVLLCAICFAVHILIIDYFSPKVDGVRMSCIQFFTCGILSGIGMLLFEEPSIGAICQAWLPILYAGALSCGVAYTLQIIGQRDTDPTVASLILSLESVISVLAGWVLLGQKLSVRELSGCVLMFAAIILAQLPEQK